MIKLIDLIPEVQAAAVSCPGFTAERAVLGAAIEFSEMSWFMQEEHDPFDLEAGVSEYELDAIPQHKITGLINVRINGERIDPFSPSQKSQRVPSWRSDIAVYPTGYVRQMSKTVKTVRLYPIPIGDVSDAVEALIALAPSRSATRIDDRFGEDHYDAIISGAIARVLDLPGHEWSNPGAAANYNQSFKDYAYSARNRTMSDVLRETIDNRVF